MRVAIPVPIPNLTHAFEANPGAFLELLSSLSAGGHYAILVRDIAGHHDGGRDNLAVSTFLRDLADALDHICPEE